MFFHINPPISELAQNRSATKCRAMLSATSDVIVTSDFIVTHSYQSAYVHLLFLRIMEEAAGSIVLRGRKHQVGDEVQGGPVLVTL